MRVLVVFVLVLFSTTVNSQKSAVDSLNIILNSTFDATKQGEIYFDIAAAYAETSLDSSIFYYKQIERLGDGIPDSLKMKMFHRLSAIYSRDKVDLDASIFYVSKGIHLGEKLKDLTLLYKMNSTLAGVLLDKGNFEGALQVHLDNIKIAERLENTNKKSWSLSGIAEVYRLKDNSTKAQEYAQKAFQLSTTLGEDQKRTKYALLLNLALAYDKNDLTQKAQDLLEANLQDAEQFSPFSGAIVAHNLGRIYIKNQEFDKAESILLDVLTVPEWSNIERRKLATLKELSTLYFERGDIKNAIALGEEAHRIAKKTNIEYHLEDTSRNLSEAYEMNGDYKKSLVLYKEYMKIQEHILDKNQSSQMLQLDAKYQKVEKEKMILRLENEKNIAARKSTLIISAICLVLLSLLGFGLYYWKRQRFVYREQQIQIKQQEAESEMMALKLKNEEMFAERQAQANEILALELKLKDRELTTNALSLMQNKEQYEHLITRLEGVKSKSNGKSGEIHSIIAEAKTSLKSYNWEEFQHFFEKVHTDFYDNLISQFPKLTPNEKKLCAFIKLGMNTKDISSITNQSSHSILIARSRLRKKMGLLKEDNLSQFVNNF